MSVNESTFLINEIYPCLQGEGINLGKPSLLVRFQICNLRCSWCDTPYTHTFKSNPIKRSGGIEQNFKRMTLDELIYKIDSHSDIKHIILSGGEPTLQNLIPIVKALSRDYSFEVESNGTQVPHKKFPSFLEQNYKDFQWNISPKFSNANENIDTEALLFWSKKSKEEDQNINFKFVIREKDFKEDIKDTLEIIKSHNIENSKVLLMAEGTSIESQIKNAWLIDICLKHKFRYTPRLHILQFENERLR